MSMPKFRPLYDRLLIEQLSAEERTKAGIIIPDTAKEKPLEGEVVAVGNGKLLEDGSIHALAVKEGDRVLFAKYSGTDIVVGGEELVILRENDVLGIVGER
jgi:chaperonin GroES